MRSRYCNEVTIPRFFSVSGLCIYSSRAAFTPMRLDDDRGLSLAGLQVGIGLRLGAGYRLRVRVGYGGFLRLRLRGEYDAGLPAGRRQKRHKSTHTCASPPALLARAGGPVCVSASRRRGCVPSLPAAASRTSWGITGCRSESSVACFMLRPNLCCGR